MSIRDIEGKEINPLVLPEWVLSILTLLDIPTGWFNLPACLPSFTKNHLLSIYYVWVLVICMDSETNNSALMGLVV